MKMTLNPTKKAVVTEAMEPQKMTKIRHTS